MIMTESSIDRTIDQERLLRDIILEVGKIPDTPVRDIVAGRHHIMVIGEHAGLCARINRRDPADNEELSGFSGSVKEIAQGLLQPSQQDTDAVSFAMAAVNSLLSVPSGASAVKAQALIRKYGKGKNVAFIGHFPFIEKMKTEFRNMWVLEKRPRPGDLDAGEADKVLPRAEVVALTATTLLNGTCTHILNLIPREAFTIMLGPSTPFAGCLFDWGIDALAGCAINDVSLVAPSIREGIPYRRLKGVDQFTWVIEKDSVKP